MRGFEKLGIIGNNGTGKTTLIKTLINEIPPLSGEYRFYKKLKFGYFDQNLNQFNPDLSLIETVHSIYPQKTLFEVRSDLARVEFQKEDVFKKVKVLSGGELVKLQILMLMLEKPDVLVLDEPTNHLDIDSKNIVEDIFEDYEGPMIFISHDRYFINKVATKIIKLDDECHVFNGNYEEYLKHTEKKVDKNPSPEKNVSRNPNKEKEKLEKEIVNTEKEIKDLKQMLFNEEVYSDLNKYNDLANLVKEKEKDLETLFAKYAEIDILV